jgi:hypothetical protein
MGQIAIFVIIKARASYRVHPAIRPYGMILFDGRNPSSIRECLRSWTAVAAKRCFGMDAAIMRHALNYWAGPNSIPKKTSAVEVLKAPHPAF